MRSESTAAPLRGDGGRSKFGTNILLKKKKRELTSRVVLGAFGIDTGLGQEADQSAVVDRRTERARRAEPEGERHHRKKKTNKQLNDNQRKDPQ